MQIPTKIKEKMLKVNALEKEIRDWCDKNLDLDDVELIHKNDWWHYLFVNEPSGEEQDNGEYSNQHEVMEGYYTGNYYYPCEDGTYLVGMIQSIV